MADSMTSGWPIDFVGAAGATLTTVCWLPQALKVVREKETRARMPMREILSIRNLLLLMGVIFGVQLTERSLGPVLLLHALSLSTTLSRRTKLTALGCNASALLVAASNGMLYAYQKPNPALLLQPATSSAASRVGLLKLVTRTKDAITHLCCKSVHTPHSAL